MKKIRFFIDDQKEETWVNSMSQQGWDLVKFSPFVYTFTEGKNTNYVYRNEFVASHDDLADYFSFLEGNGVEIVHTNKVWAYYRKEQQPDAPLFSLFTDSPSMLTYLKKRLTLFSFLVFLYLFIFVGLAVNSLGSVADESVFMNIILFTILILNATIVVLFGVMSLRLKTRIDILKQMTH